VATGGAGLEISSSPQALILIDGRPVGTSPVSVEHLAAGEHVVTFQFPGDSVSMTVELAPNEWKKVHQSSGH